MSIQGLNDSAVSTFMTQDFKYVKPTTIMTEVASIFDEVEFHHLPVLDDNQQPVGVISKHDYCQLQHHFTRFGWQDPEAQNEYLFGTLLAQEVMSRHLITLDVASTLKNANAIFLENKVHSILITEKGECVGVVTPLDILKTPIVQDYPKKQMLNTKSSFPLWCDTR